MTTQFRHAPPQSRAGLLALAGLCSCSALAEAEMPRPIDDRKEKPMSLTLSSTSFQANGMIPSLYTCEGRNISPQLAWTGVPANARSLVLIVDDPDAPDPAAPKTTWVHWVLYDLPPVAGGLAEGIAAPDLPAGTRPGLNDWNKTGYGGPCPPIGRHRYFHKLYALDTVLPDLRNPTKAALEKAMQGHILERVELIGLYQKSAHETEKIVR